MKLKAAHLLRRLERIDRDLEELDHLQNAIREDREYADRLRNSLVDESMRLGDLRRRIMSQVVHRPPESLVRNLEKMGSPSEEERPVQIIAPDEKKASRQTEPTTDSVQDQSGSKSSINNGGSEKKQRPAPPVAEKSGEKGSPQDSRKQNHSVPEDGSRKDHSQSPPFRFVYQKESEEK